MFVCLSVQEGLRAGAVRFMQTVARAFASFFFPSDRAREWVGCEEIRGMGWWEKLAGEVALNWEARDTPNIP